MKSNTAFTACIELLRATPPDSPKTPLYVVPVDIQECGRDYVDFKHGTERFAAAMKLVRPVLEARLAKHPERKEELGGHLLHLVEMIVQSFDLPRALKDRRLSRRKLSPYIEVVEKFDLKAAVKAGVIPAELLARYTVAEHRSQLRVD